MKLFNRLVKGHPGRSLMAMFMITIMMLISTMIVTAQQPTYVPTLSAVAKNVVTMMENESVNSLSQEGIGSTAAARSNLTAWGTSYCGEQPGADGCQTPAMIGTVLSPYLAQIQSDFALVPASQWNPVTFTATGMPVNVVGFVAAAKAPPTPTPVPKLIVNTSPVAISGVNGPSGVIYMPAPGVQVSSLTDGKIISQGGQFYLTTVVSGLMGKSAFFTLVQIQ